MERLSRIRGCLLAGAVGDALGNPVEFMGSGEIRRLVGEKGVRDYLEKGGNPPRALITDDTQMTLFTAEGMLRAREQGCALPHAIHQSYLDWLSTQRGGESRGEFHLHSRLLKEERLFARRAPGLTCLSALESGRAGSTAEPLNHSKGCGGVMRAAPCGMARMLSDGPEEDAFVRQGAAAAAITHGHPLGWLPAAMLAEIVHLCLAEKHPSLREVILAALEHTEKVYEDVGDIGAFRRLMEKAILLSEKSMADEEAIGRLGEGWVGDEALAIAVYCCLKHPGDMADCLSAAVTHRGDSDSTGAVAGNILGAWMGDEAIPEEYLTELELVDVIEETARQMAALEG